MSFKNSIINTILGEDNLFYVSSGSRVLLNENIDFENDDVIEIKGDDIEIDGGGCTINGNRKSVRFEIAGDYITIKNLTFKNIVMRDGDGIITHSGEGLEFHNCNFERNYKCSMEGGIITNLEGDMLLDNCNFVQNNNPRGNGGVINNQKGQITISGCDIRKNNARFGGAIFNKGRMKVEACNFSDNFASKGMSIFNAEKADLEMGICNFIREYKADEVTSLNNEINNLGVITIESEAQNEYMRKHSHGGFLHVASQEEESFTYLKDLIRNGDEKIVLDRDITFNHLDDAIEIERDTLEIDGNGHTIDGFGKSNILTVSSKHLTLKNICFKNGSGEEGSAITNNSEDLVLEDCVFERNISENGGAIKNNGNIIARDCLFENNISNRKWGGAIDNAGRILLRRCTFTSNFSRENGGAINNSKRLEIYDCEFVRNLADNGACIHNTPEGDVTIDICTFNNNKAYKKGCILLNNNKAHIRNATASNNVSSRDSNIIYQKGDESTITKIEDSIFSRDYFNNSLIFVENGTCHIESTTFDIEKDDDESYLIYNENAIVKFRDSDFNTSNVIYNDNILILDEDDDIEDYIELGESGQTKRKTPGNKELKD